MAWSNIFMRGIKLPPEHRAFCPPCNVLDDGSEGNAVPRGFSADFYKEICPCWDALGYGMKTGLRLRKSAVSVQGSAFNGGALDLRGLLHKLNISAYCELAKTSSAQVTPPKFSVVYGKKVTQTPVGICGECRAKRGGRPCRYQENDECRDRHLKNDSRPLPSRQCRPFRSGSCCV